MNLSINLNPKLTHQTKTRGGSTFNFQPSHWQLTEIKTKPEQKKFFLFPDCTAVNIYTYTQTAMEKLNHKAIKSSQIFNSFFLLLFSVQLLLYSNCNVIATESYSTRLNLFLQKWPQHIKKAYNLKVQHCTTFVNDFTRVLCCCLKHFDRTTIKAKICLGFFLFSVFFMLLLLFCFVCYVAVDGRQLIGFIVFWLQIQSILNYIGLELES